VFFGIETQSVEFGAEIDFKDGFNDRAAFPGANHFRRGFRAGEESESIDDYRFSGAGFPGQKIETVFKMDFELIDKCKISNAKEPQHTRAL